jgi:hypothetical protein
MIKPGVLLAMAGCVSLGALAAANDPPDRVIFLHYDYMVAADHSHAPDPRSIELVVEAFRRQGITLHIDPRHAEIPERRVVTFGAPDPACAGDDAVSIQDLKAAHFQRHDKLDWHYAVFAHQVNTPDMAHRSFCASDPCIGLPDPIASGFAELPGRNFVVSFGPVLDAGGSLPIGREAGTFMHELGHNLGLTHGGSGEDVCMHRKPNYISVMNYSYQQNGILVGDAPGSTLIRGCIADSDCGRGAACERFLDDIGFRYCMRIDYSARTLPTLFEYLFNSPLSGLDESVGVSGGAGDTDLVFYRTPDGTEQIGASFGPIDWNGNGMIDAARVSTDINADRSLLSLKGFDDWAFVNATLNTPHYRNAATRGNPPVMSCGP